MARFHLSAMIRSHGVSMWVFRLRRYGIEIGTLEMEQKMLENTSGFDR